MLPQLTCQRGTCFSFTQFTCYRQVKRTKQKILYNWKAKLYRTNHSTLWLSLLKQKIRVSHFQKQKTDSKANS